MSTIMFEEYELMKNSKYRMFVAAVDKALKNFEYTSEWADLISALGKLNKVLLSYTKFPLIPRRIKISKRLAQCMHPALPSGVHLKALETYDIIFKCMGTNRLASELFIYSAGIFPLLGHAAMNIRPTLLTVYETHFVPLRERLRPALSGFLSGVLPGLETGSDYFERTNILLENVCEGVGPAWFYTCIWQCVHSNGPVRLPAISYVLAHYSKKHSMEEQLHLMGNDIDVMISGLCAAVQDSSVLVQRSALDLLMVCFPMHNTLLLYADMVRLVTASLSTILRRDMSLNRRLYSWLLNTDNIVLAEDTSENKDNDSTNQGIAFDLLTEAIRTILKQSSTEIPLDIKPYRLLTSLFDKPKIGPVILDTILYDVFRSLYLSCLNQQKHKNGNVRCVSYNGNLNSLSLKDGELCKQFVTKSCQELIKNANLLFNTLQSYYIWSYIERLYEKAVKNRKKVSDKLQVNDIGTGEPNLLEICILTDFLLDIIPIETYTESTMNILPNLFKCMIISMNKNINLLEHFEITESLELCTRILRKIQPVTVKQLNKTEIDVNKVDLDKNNQYESDLFNEIDVNTKEIKIGLEKSKSDSKINENVNNSSLTIETNSRERSNSNQMLIKKKDKSSPKIDKKTRNKKSKSSSKLYDIKKEEILIDSQEKIEINKEQEITLTPEIITTKTEIKHIINCLEIYKKFYSAFIQTKILKTINVDSYFQNLINDKDERTKHLEKLLKKSLNAEMVVFCTKLDTKNQIFPKYNGDVLNSSLFNKTVSIASNILMEFSTFSNILCENSSDNLPQWLKVLLVCVCWENCPIDIRITAMNTLLDLFSLAKSQNINKTEEHKVNYVMMGILSITHVDFIEESTTVLEVMSKTLWDLLSFLNNQNQVMLCVTLLYNIHNIFDQRSFVEEVIGQSFVQDSHTVDCFKRFSLLWHLGRDLNIKLPVLKNSVRNFDRSLLKILDNLQNPQRTNVRLLSETFLNHSLLRNDMSRIINPILLKLLASSTARISIRFVNIQDSDSPDDSSTHVDSNKNEEVSSKNVYAVSNIDGNVMYHVANNPSPKQSKKKWYLFSKAGKRYTQVINMTTTITENLGVITKKNKDFKVDVSPNFERSKNNNVKLIINPLSAKEIYPNGIDGSYTKLDLNDSRNSSTDSLNSLIDLTETSNDSSLKNCLTNINFNPNPSYLHQDSGFESHSSVKSGERKSLISINEKEYLTNISETNESKISKSMSFDGKTNEKIDHLSIVHSWSYSISDSDKENYTELEISTSAEEFFKDKNHMIVKEILNEIIDNVCKENENDDETVDKSERPIDLDVKPKLPDQSSKHFTVYPMHHYICLYYEVFESDQVLYAFRSLKGCLSANPELFIKCLATSGVKDLKCNQILHLLARHRKSILGSGFYGEINQEHLNFYRGYTFLDIILSICLSYVQTYFPALDDVRLTSDEIENNFLIQLESLEILDIIISNLITIVNENTKGFAGYIADALLKCKVQKILLHCLLTAVRNFDEDLSFAEEILLFNGFKLYDANKRVSDHVEAFQIQLLRLIYHLIVLEHNVNNENAATSELKSPASNGEHLTYTPAILIPEQPMFLTAIMSALRHQNMKCLHQNWTQMITSSLPYFGANLKQISISVLHQICNNIEKLADNYCSIELAGQLCSDYATIQLESLTVLCHYCLLDSSQTSNQLNNSGNNPISNPSEILNNLMNAFFSPMPNSANVVVKQSSDYYKNARKIILSHMPRILSSIAKLWKTIVTIEGDYNGVFGNSKIVKQQLLEFLSPIAVHHSASFLAAVAVTWYERRNPFSNVKTVLPEPNRGQSNLVYLISAIRVIPLDNLVQTVIAVIKNPPPISGLKNEIRLDVSVLELFYCYMRNASATQLSEAWTSLLALVREGCSLSAQPQFLLAALLHELMIKCCPLEEKKDQRDLQDVTAKLIECVSQVCGSCLEQTTWLRRNLAVKESDENGVNYVGVVNGNTVDVCAGSSYSVQAQLVLSEILAPILDICFGSSEKDKVSTILTSLMYNIVPYLKTHTTRNMPSFKACSKLLASLSSYQYTRKAWKKDVFELLLDNALFQMDYTCLKYWKVIVDNLMTHDNTTFRDLMSRVSMTQTGGLSIFSSREQEYEQKAQLLKRLAFVIFCSETDQYAKYMPDIQEQLTTSLRYNVPGIQAQVFTCFRVLLIRMSPIHITCLWPIIISEMLQVFLQIEQELTTDTEEFRNNSSSHIKLLSVLDASWATNSNNGLHALGHPHYLRLQLSTAKLLDLALLLPATSLPQFQMYRWAFVGDEGNHSESPLFSNSEIFVPHITRIANLMDQKFSDTLIETLPTKPNELLLTVNSVSQLKDLHGFFKTLSLCSNRHRSECNGSTSGEHVNSDRQTDKKMSILLEKIDKVIESDFLEKISK